MVETRVSRTTASAPVADERQAIGGRRRRTIGGRAVAIAADGEHVPEVGVDLERQVKGHRMRRAVQDADPLAQAAIDEPSPSDRERLSWQRAAIGQGHRIVDQLDRGHVRLAVAGREQQRRLAIERQLEPAQEADVVEVEAEAGTGRVHRAVLRGDDDGVALLEGDGGDRGAGRRRDHGPSP